MARGLAFLVPMLGMLGMLGMLAACGDPYERYAGAVRADVDGATRAAFDMTARLQRTVVHNQIPDDSMTAAAATVTRAAREVRNHAVHFARIVAPADLAAAHAGLNAALTRVAAALDSLGAVFQQCSARSACQAHLDSVSHQFQFVGEDLHNGRQFVQRLLLRHGVILR